MKLLIIYIYQAPYKNRIRKLVNNYGELCIESVILRSQLPACEVNLLSNYIMTSNIGRYMQNLVLCLDQIGSWIGRSEDASFIRRYNYLNEEKSLT